MTTPAALPPSASSPPTLTSIAGCDPGLGSFTAPSGPADAKTADVVDPAPRELRAPPCPDWRSAPLIVAGMHRSGTSLVASWLHAAGVDMGRRLLAANAANPHGYFEDEEILDLQRRMLASAVPPGEDGHADWGWTESERLDRASFADYRAAAVRLLAARADARPWGFKDPRSSLALEFWLDLLPGARFLLLYRLPWEVADSMQRLGAETFLRRPDYAYRIWAFYNRHLLAFAASHPQQAILVSSNALVRDPEKLAGALERLGIAIDPTSWAHLFADASWTTREPDDPLGPLSLTAFPECAEVLRELDRRAQLPAHGLWRGPEQLRPRWKHGGQAGEEVRSVSVVIPCHDDGELAIEALASVERSRADDVEVILVDDGSTLPRTLAILESLAAAGYIVLRQPRSGLSAARNRGFAAAKAPYVVPLDADDRLRPDFIQRALAVLSERSEVGVVYGDRWEWGLRKGTVRLPDLDPAALLAHNYLDACAMVRSAVWEGCGGYDVEMAGWEDWDFWVNALRRGWGFVHLPGIAFDSRVRPASLASTLTDEVRLELRRHMIQKHRDFYSERLPEILVRWQQTFEGTAKQLAAPRDAMAVERAGGPLPAPAAATGTPGKPASDETDDKTARAHEREAFAAELESWRSRVLFMERTRAWRLRSLLVRLKHWRFGRNERSL